MLRLELERGENGLRIVFLRKLVVSHVLVGLRGLHELIHLNVGIVAVLGKRNCQHYIL